MCVCSQWSPPICCAEHTQDTTSTGAHTQTHTRGTNKPKAISWEVWCGNQGESQHLCFGGGWAGVVGCDLGGWVSLRRGEGGMWVWLRGVARPRVQGDDRYGYT